MSRFQGRHRLPASTHPCQFYQHKIDEYRAFQKTDIRAKATVADFLLAIIFGGMTCSLLAEY